MKRIILIPLSLLFITNVRADVMNLNEFMPTRMEDATVTDLHTVDVQGTARFNRGDDTLHWRPLIRWGMLKRFQIEANSDQYKGSKSYKEKNSGSTSLGFQWNFNDQDDWVPSLALSPQVTFPTGKGSDGIDPAVKLILTYTLAGTLTEPVGQLHINYRWFQNNQPGMDEAKIGNFFLVGYIHKIGGETSIQADFNHEYDVFSKYYKNETEFGLLHQLTNSWLMGIGTGYDLKKGYFSTTLAIQKTF